MSLGKEDIINQLKEIFLDTFTSTDYEFSEETSREDIEEWDSLNNIRLLTAIEAEFGFNFDLNEIEELTDISTIADIIHNRLK